MKIRERIEKEIQKHNKKLLSTSNCLTPYEVNKITLKAILIEIKKEVKQLEEEKHQNNTCPKCFGFGTIPSSGTAISCDVCCGTGSIHNKLYKEKP